MRPRLPTYAMVDDDDAEYGPPPRRTYPSLLQSVCGSLARRAYGAASLLELWHARRPWVTRLLIPLTIMYVWWSAMADPNALLMEPVSTLSPAACAALLASKGRDGLETGGGGGGGGRAAGAQSLTDAMTLVAGDSKRVLLAETNSGYGALATNWVKHVQELRPKLTNYLVVALDRAEGARLAAADVNAYYDRAGCVAGAAGGHREPPREGRCARQWTS